MIFLVQAPPVLYIAGHLKPDSARRMQLAYRHRPLVQGNVRPGAYQGYTGSIGRALVIRRNVVVDAEDAHRETGDPGRR
jgi:hypothetical protein